MEEKYFAQALEVTYVYDGDDPWEEDHKGIFIITNIPDHYDESTGVDTAAELCGFCDNDVYYYPTPEETKEDIERELGLQYRADWAGRKVYLNE